MLCLISFGGLLGYIVLNDRQETSYPGSAELSNHDVFKLSPHLYYRHDTVYRTDDDFPKVYRWYANAFGLGPQTQGQHNCTSIFRSEIFFRIKTVMTVTLCDSSNGRLIFTERTWRVELP